MIIRLLLGDSREDKGIVPFTGLHTALARYNVLNVVGYNVCNVG